MMEVTGSSPFLHVYTIIHVLISLIAIGSGFGVLVGWLFPMPRLSKMSAA